MILIPVFQQSELKQVRQCVCTQIQIKIIGIEKAIIKAKEENKYVFVNYTSKSCELSDKFKEQIQNDSKVHKLFLSHTKL